MQAHSRDFQALKLSMRHAQAEGCRKPKADKAPHPLIRLLHVCRPQAQNLRSRQGKILQVPLYPQTDSKAFRV